MKVSVAFEIGRMLNRELVSLVDRYSCGARRFARRPTPSRYTVAVSFALFVRGRFRVYSNRGVEGERGEKPALYDDLILIPLFRILRLSIQSPNCTVSLLGNQEPVVIRSVEVLHPCLNGKKKKNAFHEFENAGVVLYPSVCTFHQSLPDVLPTYAAFHNGA